jgi:hypothetical protein
LTKIALIYTLANFPLAFAAFTFEIIWELFGAAFALTVYEYLVGEFLDIWFQQYKDCFIVLAFWADGLNFVAFWAVKIIVGTPLAIFL